MPEPGHEAFCEVSLWSRRSFQGNCLLFGELLKTADPRQGICRVIIPPVCEASKYILRRRAPGPSLDTFRESFFNLFNLRGRASIHELMMPNYLQ
jgi:hypothetical protein